MSNTIRLKDIWLIPNLITISRVLLLPLFIYFCFQENKTLETIVIYLILMFSDVLDGFLSRRLNQVSNLGKLLDPLSDKIVILGIAISLVWTKGFPLAYLIVLGIRDMILIVGAAFIYSSKHFVGQANFWGKMTTLSLSVLFFSYIWTPSIILNYIFLILSIIIFTISTFIYFKNFYYNYKESSD